MFLFSDPSEQLHLSRGSILNWEKDNLKLKSGEIEELHFVNYLQQFSWLCWQFKAISAKMRPDVY